MAGLLSFTADYVIALCYFSFSHCFVVAVVPLLFVDDDDVVFRWFF